jgi:hypothetical protein
MTDKQEVTFFNHRVGDGLHYITDNFKTFPDGSFQLGDTSENCVLYNLHLALFRHGLDRLNILWNQVYPDDTMSFEDLAYIIGSAIHFTEAYSPESPENLRDMLNDIRSIDCGKLADLVENKLKEKGVKI